MSALQNRTHPGFLPRVHHSIKVKDEDTVSPVSAVPTWAQAAVNALKANATALAAIGVSNPATEILYGDALATQFGKLADVVPQIVIAPDVGTLYSGSQAKVSDHGGCGRQLTCALHLSLNVPFSSFPAFLKRVLLPIESPCNSISALLQHIGHSF